jgi:Rrf2 family iron-sulfur cluster assembly transcriptional regulator
MLSNTSKYAIRAVIYLSLNTSNGIKLGIKQISKDLKIPTPFLGKILQTLAKHKILTSTKGPHGGFCLGRKADEIKLIDIVNIIDGEDIFKKCIIRLENCSDTEPCSMHERYSVIRSQLLNLFQNQSISELIKDIKEGKRKVII